MMARSKCGSNSEEKTGIAESSDSSVALSSRSDSSVGPSITSFFRMRAKKKDFLRASPIAQYSCASDSMAQIEGYPINRASQESSIPIAAEIAMRVPAYEPGPSPTVMVCGAPNFRRTACRLSKKSAEFFRSLGHCCVNSISPSSHARLPREVESSSARVFMIVLKQSYHALTLRFYFKGNPPRLLWN